MTHDFLYLPECPIPLLGRDLRTKLGAQITFAPGKSASIYVREPIGSDDGCDCAREGEWHLCSSGREQINPPSLLKQFPDVWAEEGPPGLAKNHARIVVDLRPGATPVGQTQYPVLREARLGIQDHIRCLQDAKILIGCQSPWNTLLLPVKKSGGNNYRPVQDLCAVNSAVITIYPVVLNPTLS